MKVLAYGLKDKLGEDGLKEFSLGTFNPGQMTGYTQCVFLVHGTPDSSFQSGSQGLFQAISEGVSPDSSTWALWLGSGPMHETIAEYKNGRVVGLKWGIANLQNGETWENHPRWKTDRLRAFCVAVTEMKDGEPPWHLLDPPRVPENVIACYLCALGKVEPEAGWKDGFEAEVDYWNGELARRSGNQSQGGINLSWVDDYNKEDHQRYVDKLRVFLTATQALIAADGAGKPNG